MLVLNLSNGITSNINKMKNKAEKNKLIAKFMKSKEIHNYHSQWGELLNVVGRCFIVSDKLKLDGWDNKFRQAFYSADIDEMYKHVVMFIEHYNQQKNKK